jgi:hypothetical protein
MIILIPILIAAIVAAFYFRKKPQSFNPQPFNPQAPATAKQAYCAYYSKHDLITNPKHYNRIAFHLVNDIPIFLDDSPYTSAYIQPAEQEMLTDNDEVYCMVVVQSSQFGYISHSKKQAKKAILLLFHPKPFRELGDSRIGIKLSWHVDHLNYHVVDNHFMKCNQLESFVARAIGEYDFEETH